MKSLFLFLKAPKSRVNFNIFRKWSIVTNATRYHYNDNEGDINRKTTIMIITN